MIKKLISASLIYALAPQFPKLVSLFMMPFITAQMTAADYGLSGILMAYLACFEAFNDLGLKASLTNVFYRFPKKFDWIWKKLHGFIQLWSLVYGTILIGVLIVVVPEIARKDLYGIIFLLIVPIAIFNPICDLGRIYFQYSKRPLPFSVITAIGGIITVVGNYLFIVVLKWGYLGLFAGQFVSGFYSFLVYIFILYFKNDFRPDYSWSFKWIKRKLQISIPTIPHYYAGFIINVSDRLFLEWWKVPFNQIGQYSFAYSFGVYFSIIGKSFMQASGPYYFENLKLESENGESQNWRMTKIGQDGLLIFAFLLSLWLREIFSVLVKNDELAQSFAVSLIIIFSYTYFPAYAQISNKLWYLEKTKVLMKITVTAAIISIISNNIFIPFFGIFGSAIATFLSLMYMGYGGYYNMKVSSILGVKSKFSERLLVTILMLFFALGAANVSVGVKMVVTVLFLLGSYLWLRKEYITKFV